MNILFLERKDRGEKKKVREEQWLGLDPVHSRFVLPAEY